MKDELKALEKRLINVERTNALYRRVLCLLAIACALVVLVAAQHGAEKPRRLVGRELALVDENGRQTVLLRDGVMQFLRADGKSNLILSAQFLMMTPEDGDIVTVNSTGAMGPSISLLGRSGRFGHNSIVASAHEMGGPAIEIVDGDGYRTSIGRNISGNVTGPKPIRVTTAAAMTMFSPDKRIMSSAPTQ
jgi:hypothetical protein